MLSLEEAQSRLLEKISSLGAETQPLIHSDGRVLAEEVTANIDLPPFDNSAMDGYAVRAEDVAAASGAAPVALRIIEHIAAGSAATETLQSGTASRIFTGSPLPEGADAVVMQEDTRLAGQFVEILDRAAPFENVRLRGEDVKRGEVIGTAGTILDAGKIGVLAATGIANVSVGRAPIVGLLSTGTELREPGHALAPGTIYESNRSLLYPLICGVGSKARVYPLVQDTLAGTREALAGAFAECDCVVTTGGVSVGEHDYVKEAFESIGGVLNFWRVSIRPGKPFVFGTRGEGKFLFGLPGNPVSAFVTFLLLVRPALLQMQGAKDIGLRKVSGRMAERLVNDGNRRHFVRVIVDENGEVRSSGSQGSHRVGSLARANGLVDVAANSCLEPGTAVRVMQW